MGIKFLLFILKIYMNFISPFISPRCRFYPSCSRYCYEAVEQFGILKGLFLGFKRVLRCHPFNDGGYDPVPEKFTGKPILKKCKREGLKHV